MARFSAGKKNAEVEVLSYERRTNIENIFRIVKNNITTRDVAEHYGLLVKANGMACCIFHDDRNPSMKVDSRFHCFGCGADGDVIDFAAQLFGLPPKQAAEELAADFGLSTNSRTAPTSQEDEIVQKYRSYLFLLESWRQKYIPTKPSEPLHLLFVEALHWEDCTRYVLQTLEQYTPRQRAKWKQIYKKEVQLIEQRIRKHKKLDRQYRARNAGKDIER